MTPRIRVLRLAAPAIALVTSPVALAAQSYARTVWTQLDGAYENASANGYSTRNYIIGRLDDDETDTWSLTLDRGNVYLIVGACDQDCRDIDITVLDSSGQEIAKDTQADDTPTVSLRPTSTGTYRIRVRMYDCRSNPCYFGFGLFFKSG